VASPDRAVALPGLHGDAQQGSRCIPPPGKRSQYLLLRRCEGVANQRAQAVWHLRQVEVGWAPGRAGIMQPFLFEQALSSTAPFFSISLC